MIKFIKGDLFNSKMYALVNTVNCVGVMGKGIALEFKKRFPHYFKVYKETCDLKELEIGELLIIYDLHFRMKERMIVSFPTKKHWRNPSEYEYIEKGLEELVKLIYQHEIKEIAMPALGCTNGGLDWEVVKEMIVKHLSLLENIEIEVYEPNTHN